ncbi:hypothetical protein [Mucilaginibacter humi]|uniref:hypothetical protein n=1 Tax=Mucilaginibacter humi TaxID=2732510 RepID=UPI003744A7B6
MAALYVDKLRSLKNIYRGLEHEDEMVELFNHTIYDRHLKRRQLIRRYTGFYPLNISTTCTPTQLLPSRQQKMVSK